MYKGVLYMLLSSLCFAMVNLIVKTLGGDGNNYFVEHYGKIQDYPAYELIFFRSIVSLVICSAIIRARKIPFFGVNKKWLVTRGVFGATALTLFFLTLDNLPIAIATTVQYLSPIFTIIFAIYLHNEKVKPIQWLFFAISLSGVVTIAYGKTKLADPQLIWLLVGVISAALSGVAYNAIIKCRETDAPITVVMYFPLIATPVMLLISLYIGFVVPQGIEWIMLLLIGLLTQVAQVSMTRAFNSDAAAKIAPVKYVGAIYAVCIGYFIFDEKLSLYAAVGISLVLIGVLLNTFIKNIALKRKQRF